MGEQYSPPNSKTQLVDGSKVGLSYYRPYFLLQESTMKCLQQVNITKKMEEEISAWASFECRFHSFLVAPPELLLCLIEFICLLN